MKKSKGLRKNGKGLKYAFTVRVSETSLKVLRDTAIQLKMSQNVMLNNLLLNFKAGKVPEKYFTGV